MFKKGDKVRNKETGAIDTVESVYGMPEYDMVGYGLASEGFVLKNLSWEIMRDWELFEKKEFRVGQTIRIPIRPCKGGEPCEDIITRISDLGMIITEKHAHYIEPLEEGFEDIEIIKDVPQKEEKHIFHDLADAIREELEEEKAYSYCMKTYEPLYKPDWLSEIPKPKTTLKEVRHMLSILARKLLDSDVKALVEAGYLNSELEVTSKGSEAVYAMFFEQNKTELAKRARAELKKAKREEE